MFRLLKLKPPHGWNAVAWELAIVTLGVLLALGAQQWAEKRSERAIFETSKTALRAELAEHYGYAVEFRVVYPCLRAQLDRLRNRVLSSGAALDPAPIYSENAQNPVGSPNRGRQGAETVIEDEFVFRKPTKFYPTDAWEEAIGEGVAERFDPATRRQLAGHYASLANVARLDAANLESEQGLMVLAYPLPVDSSTRVALVQDIDRLSSRLQWLDTMNGQLLDYIQHIGMLPKPEMGRKVTERYGTYRFCTAQRLPLRPYRDAMTAVPN